MEALEGGLANRVVASTAMNAAVALNSHPHESCFVSQYAVTKRRAGSSRWEHADALHYEFVYAPLALHISCDTVCYASFGSTVSIWGIAEVLIPQPRTLTVDHLCFRRVP